MLFMLWKKFDTVIGFSQDFRSILSVLFCTYPILILHNVSRTEIKVKILENFKTE
jgi:hypothetical protein